MSCFSFFPSKEKRRSRRHASRRAKSPIVHGSPPHEPPPAGNHQMVPAENKNHKAASPMKKSKDTSNNQAANHIAAQTFTFRELAAITKNFRQESLIGEGGFGRVYKGKLAKTGQVNRQRYIWLI
ncbi:hypothetical protein M8C21_012756 [Ambrosia artemisiifolia]|uniref:Uncharacterized protein n=1 Tax=Ambrosia artemisiifolia TaxID=4212 RepID=A0AAD5D324_AMBAR|nr:hypothetical protein M8C21_012756 [Ambrosia artemisiifolia]